MVCVIKTSAVYIPSLDGKDIFVTNNYIDSKQNGYHLKLKSGEYNIRKFINTLDFSLDLIKLREVYKKVYRRRDFSFFMNNEKEYTPRVINVTFQYANKAFNKVGLNTYIKFGYMVSDSDFVDCVCVRDGELIGIQTERDVQCPIMNEVLGKYFYFDEGVYKARSNIHTLHSVAEIRKSLYKNGFICDGVKYVRFKRSGGSSRVGKCLFIDEKLYYRMHKWEMCGIEVKNGDDIDLASLEPYIALTLSSIIDTITIYPENILVVDDYKSIFTDRVIATRLVNGRLSSKAEIVEIENKIWDGQSLMDKSLFGKYEKYGMLLLRSRFFKSCCFNSNLQQWFADNGITDVSQLNGYTRAKNIKDVKLITTPSSIKYLKFGTLDKWLDLLEPIFGVVKHEKKTHFFDGRMVQTHYQLLNTLQMTLDEVKRFIEPSLDYVMKLKTNPAVLRNHIKFHYCNDDFQEEMTQSLLQRNDIVYRMLGVNEDFTNTKFYYQFRKDILSSYISNLRNGHVLVHGNYSTLCGNPIELLKQAIGKFDGTSSIAPETVHNTKFENGIELLGSRSPHVTMGNILVTKNVFNPLISTYMNPTEEIVYVNSIGENILERLSGADFDSDTMLLTDNEILVSAAKRNYHNFPVPTKLIDSLATKRRYLSEEQADLDIKTSVNKIGEIINLSQELNSLLWDEIHSGKSIDDVMDLYCDIAQLDIMSNLEIDSAKRENPANNTFELCYLKKKYDQRDPKNRHIRPLFFQYIDDAKGYREGYISYLWNESSQTYDKKNHTSLKDAKKSLKEHSDSVIEIEKGRISYRSFQTSMDYLQKTIDQFSIRCSRKNLIPLSSMLVPASDNMCQVNYGQVHRIIELVRKCKFDISCIWDSYKDMEYWEKSLLASERRNTCVNTINKIDMNDKTVLYLLTLLEHEDYRDIKSLLFIVLFSIPNKDLLHLIRNSKSHIGGLRECEDGDILLYLFHYKQVNLDDEV